MKAFLRAVPTRGPLLVLLFFLLGGCNGDKPSKPIDTPSGVVPDFRLQDVNPNSPTHGDTISPRNYLGQISGWYFGHAT